MSRILLLAGLLALLAAPTAHAKGADRDGDRLPDRWEQRFNARSPAADRDRDGLTNWAEYRANTHPRRRDTDRDGRPDGREDRDRDGLVNRFEEPTGHDPADRDSDDDGVRDGRENAGRVVSLKGGVLTLDTGRRRVRGTVGAGTVVECGDAGEEEANDEPLDEPVEVDETPPGDGADDDGDDGERASEQAARRSLDAHFDGGEPADGEVGDDGEAEPVDVEEDVAGDPVDAPTCTLDDLARGVFVHEADATRVGGRLVFTRIELAGE